MEEDQVDVGLAERVAGLEGLLGRVDQAEVDHHDARPLELPLDAIQVDSSRSLSPANCGQ